MFYLITVGCWSNVSTNASQINISNKRCFDVSQVLHFDVNLMFYLTVGCWSNVSTNASQINVINQRCVNVSQVLHFDVN